MTAEGVAARLEGVRAALSAGSRTAYAVRGEVFGAPPSAPVGVWQLGEIMAYLRHLRLKGIVDRRSDGGIYQYRLR
jgi:hypothetical protein